MRACAVPFLLLTTACGPAAISVYEGDYAVRLRDGCIEATTDSAPLGESITVETWVRVEGGSSAPLVVAEDALELYIEGGGTGLRSSNGDVWHAERSVADGEVHHVAATWSVDGVAVFVDGEVAAEGAGGSPPPPAAGFWLGCSPDGRALEGTLDEVRISTRIRYDGPFEPAVLPFEPDEGTLALWHFDSGTGTDARDERNRFDATIEGGTWVPGLLRAAVEGRYSR